MDNIFPALLSRCDRECLQLLKFAPLNFRLQYLFSVVNNTLPEYGVGRIDLSLFLLSLLPNVQYIKKILTV